MADNAQQVEEVPDWTTPTVDFTALGPTPDLTRWADEDAVLVCMDLETHCRNQSYNDFRANGRSSQHRVTQIGMASFDPRRIAPADAGDRGVNTWQFIKARNYAIIEHKHDPKVGKHPHWCNLSDANDFEFGKTTWIRKNTARENVVRQIRRGFLNDNSNIRGAYRNSRPIVFLFFDGRNDTRWLAGLDIDLSTEFPNSRVIDIQHDQLASAVGWRRNKHTISAADMFSSLAFQVSHAHNGGNDAVYELRSYIAGMTLRDAERSYAVNLPSLQDLRKLDIHGEYVATPENEGLGPRVPTVEDNAANLDE